MKFLPIFLLFCFPAFSQKSSKDTLVRYFNVELEPCKKKEFVFIGVVVRDAIGWNGIVYDDSGHIIMRGKYKDDDCIVKDGWFMYYYPNGKRSVGGRFEQNSREGLWMRWYTSGQIRDSLFFQRNLPEGSYFSWFENANPESAGIYRAGKMSHDWTFYHENGKVASREKYEGDKLADIECFDTSGHSTGINCAVLRNPEIKGKYGGMLKYMQDSIVYPPQAKKNEITGVVQVEFTVTKDGQLTDFRILSSPDTMLSDEVIRVVKSVPGWYPAISHNRLMDFTFKMNVPFYGEQVPITGSWRDPRFENEDF